MESTRSQREKRKSSGEADARGKRTRSESNENRPLLSKSSSAKIKEHGLPSRKQQKRRKKKLLLSIAQYLKDNGFSKSFEELLSNAKIKEDDLKKPVPDLEEIYAKHYFLTEEEPQDELVEEDPDAVNDTKAALLVPSIAEPNDDSQEHSQHDMADESLDSASKNLQVTEDAGLQMNNNTSILCSIAKFLNSRGFAKISEELLSKAQIKEDLNQTFPDLEDIYCKFQSKEGRVELSEPRDDEKENTRSESDEDEDEELLTMDQVMERYNASQKWTDMSNSWEIKRPDINPEHQEQLDDDCWTWALSRAQNTSVLLSGSERPLLTQTELKDGVSRRYQNLTRGIRHILHAREFMIDGNYVDDMIVHRRPANFDPDFEDLIEKLLIKSHVAICFELPPSFSSYGGIGVFIPTVVETRLGTFERFPEHCVLLTGYGKRLQGGRMIDYWRYMDSQGRDWGENGFGCLARYMNIIKLVVQLKV